MGLAWAWRELGVSLAWAWRGLGVGLAWAWRELGVSLAWAWRGLGVGLAWERPSVRRVVCAAEIPARATCVAAAAPSACVQCAAGLRLQPIPTATRGAWCGARNGRAVRLTRVRLTRAVCLTRSLQTVAAPVPL